MNEGDLERLVGLIRKKNNFTVCLPMRLSLDAVCAATSLYLGLAKLGKPVSLASSAESIDEFEVTGVEKITSSLTADGDNLVISFPYAEGAIDKVSYNIEGNRFNLVIKPKDGFDRLDPNSVQYSNSGGKVDGIFVFDSPNLDALGPIYTDNEDSFKGIEIVNIDRHMTNSNFGTINIVAKQNSSLSEVIFQLLYSLRVELDADIATNLYTGLVAATNNFSSYTVNADTFQVAAALLKAGAARKSLSKITPEMSSMPQRVPMSTSGNNVVQQIASSPAQQGRLTQPTQQISPQMARSWFDMLPQEGFEEEQNDQEETPITASPVMQPKIKTQTREKASQVPQDIEAKESTIEEKNPPKDWLKPKIFKGGGLV